MRVEFTIPGDPVAKGRPRFGNGRTYTPEATRDYEDWIEVFARQAMRLLSPMEGAVKLMLTVVMPIPQGWSKKRRDENAVAPEYHIVRPDFDNLAKAVGDACNGIVWRDDSQIAFSVVLKIYGEKPRVEVVAETLGRHSFV